MNVCCDIKRTYFKLWDQLLPYKEMLTYREGATWNKSDVKVVFVGDLPDQTIESESVGLISIEGTVASLDQNIHHK